MQQLLRKRRLRFRQNVKDSNGERDKPVSDAWACVARLWHSRSLDVGLRKVGAFEH